MYRLAFILILFTSHLSAQTYPPIKTARPRIYIDSTRFAWLRNNISSGECGETFNRYRNAVYNAWYNDPPLYLLGADSTQWTWTFSNNYSHDEAIYAATLYKLTGDPLELKRCRYIIREINNRYDTLNFDNYAYFPNEDFIRWLSDVGGILLDWCYDDLPVDMRQHLIRNMYKVCRYFMQVYINSSNGDSYVSSHNAWNTIFANQYAIVLNNADGLTSEQMDTVQQWYQTTLDKWDNGFEPCYAHYRDDDGGWNWSAAYSMWSLIDQFQFFENMRIATGKDYYHDLPWVENSINQYWHMIQPDYWTINSGDGFTDLHGDRVVYLHARYFNDPRSLWLAQFWSQPPYLQLYNYTPPLFRKLMYLDFEMPSVTKPEVPTDWWSDKTGLSVSRTSWDTDAAMVWFFNSPSKKAAHEHRDNNTFCIFKDKPQIIHSGYYDAYGNSHYVNYHTRTIAHNSICVYDSTEQYVNWGNNVSNDGGQIESPTLYTYEDIFKPQFQRGEWLDWGYGENYSYSIADAASSYDPDKLDRFTRRVLFYKPDQVIVLDHLGLQNTDARQRDAKWILHFQNQPHLSGNLINSEVPDHIETFDGKDIVQANGKGNVAVRTLLPLNTTTTRIGGIGYEFYVDGINYPVASAMDTVHTTPGKWRIEVSPKAVSDTLVFLHTIKIGDDIRPSMAGGFGQQNEYTIGVDWDNTLFFFDAEGGTNSEYQVMYDIPGDRTVNIFAADLDPGTTYLVGVDNTDYTSFLIPDSNGILQLALVLTPGNHMIDINKQTLSIDKPGQAALRLALFPNPADGTLIVQFIGHDFTGADVIVYNQYGSEMVKETMSPGGELNVSTWPAGIYFAHYVIDGHSGSIRFVVSH